MPAKLCVLAAFDEATSARIRAIQEVLFAAGHSGRQSKRLPKHITLDIRSMDEADKTAHLLEQAASSLAPFPVYFNHLGLFPGGRVLFVAPDPSHSLLRLRGFFAPPESWSPHATLLIEEQERILSALPLALSAFAPFEGRITRLGLTEVGSGKLFLELPLTGSDP